MSAAPMHARVFVVGCPRSGTTLLQSLLAAHPRAKSFPESHFFSAILQLPFDQGEQRLQEFCRVSDLPLPSPPGPTSQGGRVAQFVAMLDAAACGQGKDVWVEKTPLHLHHIDTISQHLPDARFVHLLRAGPPTITSLYRATQEHPEHWDGARSWRKCAQRWIGDVRISLRRMGDPAHHLLRYEELVEAPGPTLEAVCSFLGIAHDPAMLRDHAHAADDLVLNHERWKERARTSIEVRTRGRTLFEASAGEQLRRRVVEAQQDLDQVMPLRGASQCG